MKSYASASPKQAKMTMQSSGVLVQVQGGFQVKKRMICSVMRCFCADREPGQIERQRASPTWPRYLKAAAIVHIALKLVLDTMVHRECLSGAFSGAVGCHRLLLFRRYRRLAATPCFF